MKALKLLSFITTLVVLPAASHAEQAKKPHKAHYRVQPAVPVINPQYDISGNAALGGNNANSAYGSNSANENANGRSGGGFGN